MRGQPLKVLVEVFLPIFELYRPYLLNFVLFHACEALLSGVSDNHPLKIRAGPVCGSCTFGPAVSAQLKLQIWCIAYLNRNKIAHFLVPNEAYNSL